MSYDQRRGSHAARKRRHKRRLSLESVTRIGLLITIVLVLVLAIVLITKCNKGKDEAETTTKPIVITSENISSDGEADTTTDGETTTLGDGEEPTTLDPASVYGDNIVNDGQVIICIDPGHGGIDGGCVGDNDRLEKDDALKLSLAVKREFEALGATVVMTRSDDSDISKFERPAFANSKNADVLLSIHRNSYTSDASVKGVEAWISSSNPTNSSNLSNAILTSLDTAGITRNRGIRTGTQGNAAEDYAINSQSLMPSLILEMGFITCPEDNSNYDNKMDTYAKAIASAVYDWVNAQ